MESKMTSSREVLKLAVGVLVIRFGNLKFLLVLSKVIQTDAVPKSDIKCPCLRGLAQRL